MGETEKNVTEVGTGDKAASISASIEMVLQNVQAEGGEGRRTCAIPPDEFQEPQTPPGVLELSENLGIFEDDIYVPGLTRATGFHRGSPDRNNLDDSDIKAKLARLHSVGSVCSKCGVQQIQDEEDSLCCICFDKSRNRYKKEDQLWLTQQEILDNFSPINEFSSAEPELVEIRTVPTIFLGQRAFLVQTSSGNILWDCVTHIDTQSIKYIQKLGGLKAIVIANPEHMATFTIWSSVFDNCPVFIHEMDRKWMNMPYGDAHVTFWEGERYALCEDVRLVHLGGHFDGSCILHRERGEGFILSSNTLKVGADRMSVSIMKSYRNLIPLHPREAQRIAVIMKRLGLEFDRVYGNLPNDYIHTHGKQIVRSSLIRYIQWACRENELTSFKPVSIAARSAPVLDLETYRREIAKGKRKVA